MRTCTKCGRTSEKAAWNSLDPEYRGLLGEYVNANLRVAKLQLELTIMWGGVRSEVLAEATKRFRGGFG